MQPTNEPTEIHNEGEWGEDGVADVAATLIIVTVLVVAAVVFVAGA